MNNRDGETLALSCTTVRRMGKAKRDPTFAPVSCISPRLDSYTQVGNQSRA